MLDSPATSCPHLTCRIPLPTTARRVRGLTRRALQRCGDDRFDLLVDNRARSDSWPWFVEQTFKTLSHKLCPPLARTADVHIELMDCGATTSSECDTESATALPTRWHWSTARDEAKNSRTFLARSTNRAR